MAAPATPVSNSQLARSPGTSAASLVFNRSRNASGESGATGEGNGGWIFDGTAQVSSHDGPKWVTNGRRSKTQPGPGKTINVEVKNRIFIGGLQSNMNEDDLRTLFGQYGEITEVLIKERGTQERRGFGFVTYGNKPGRSGEEAAAVARKEGADERLEIRGVKINVQRATRIVHTSDDQRSASGNAAHQPQMPVMPFLPQMPFIPMMNPAAFYPPQYYPYDMFAMNRGLPSTQPGWPAGMPANQMWPMTQGFSNAPVMPPMQYAPAMHTPPPDAEGPAIYSIRTPINSANRGTRDLERSSAGGRSVASSDGRRADGRVPGIRISDFDDDSEDLTVRLSQSMNLDANYDGGNYYPMHTRNSRLV